MVWHQVYQQQPPRSLWRRLQHLVSLLVQLLLWLLVMAIADPHFLGQREWITWPGYGKFWTQVVRQTMRSSDARGMHAEIVRRGLSADVTADLTDAAGRFVNQAAVQLTVIGPQLHPENPCYSRRRRGGTQPVSRPVHRARILCLLQQIAAVSGGRYWPEAAEVFDKPGRRATRPVPLWP